MNGASDTNKPYNILKECNDNFQMNICKLLLQIYVSCWDQHKIAKNSLFWTM